MSGKMIPIEADEFDVPLAVEELRLINARDHSWYEYRNFGGPAIPSIGYGFVAAALAEETNGVWLPPMGRSAAAGITARQPSGFLHGGETSRWPSTGRKPFDNIDNSIRANHPDKREPPVHHGLVEDRPERPFGGFHGI
ncbi:hypothetical protein BW12_01080 [Bifidobacterium sp. UTCIF-3]|uniref:hypothetical protein n=1 Tax=unclassified Bifidobacterium TaxID=2608897 RepID=UPI00112DB996|nr:MULTISPECIES: hypothetical protein [unclassified Bifidobacterium]TPF83090.1 hypothetical protein BW12_01080 [Bifidobacterium sp. UTCIF-3]